MSRVIIGKKHSGQEPWHEYLQAIASRSRKIWKMLGIEPWDLQCLQLVHRWAGHVARYSVRDPNRWAYLLMCWKDSAYIDERRARSSDGRRLNRGHQRPPWRRDHHIHFFYKTNSSGIGCDWRVQAQNKSTWSHNENAWARNRTLVATNFHM